MKKVKIFMLFLFITSFAMAQEEEKQISENTVTENSELKSDISDKENITPEIKTNIKEEETAQSEIIAVSNSKNLKMLFVASNLFTTRNYALV